MLCEFCRAKLNPYLLKQVVQEDNELIFEVECLNCRKYNYISEETYFHLRKDWIMPTIQPINNKLPSEMNVIFVSMERCGISWIIRTLSDVHEEMFGIPIMFETKKNTEISYVVATRDRLPLPLKWNNVYNVDPQRLVDKIDPNGNKYDRVIIIQRDYETMIKVHELYFNEEWTGKQRETAMRKTKEHYQLVYGREVNDYRCKKFQLEDLNNYTIASFTEMLDFLNFPLIGRPTMITINPSERNWQVYSSVLSKGHEVCNRLQIIKKENKTI